MLKSIDIFSKHFSDSESMLGIALLPNKVEPAPD